MRTEPENDVVAFTRDVLGEPLTPWQERVITRAFDPEQAFRAASDGIALFRASIRPVFERLGRHLTDLFEQLDREAETEQRDLRIRALRHEYRRRRRGRW